MDLKSKLVIFFGDFFYYGLAISSLQISFSHLKNILYTRSYSKQIIQQISITQIKFYSEFLGRINKYSLFKNQIIWAPVQLHVERFSQQTIFFLKYDVDNFHIRIEIIIINFINTIDQVRYILCYSNIKSLQDFSLIVALFDAKFKFGLTFNHKFL